MNYTFKMSLHSKHFQRVQKYEDKSIKKRGFNKSTFLATEKKRKSLI